MAIANSFFSPFTLTRPRVTDSDFTALIRTAPIPAIRRGFIDSRVNLSTKRIMLRASVSSTSMVGPDSPVSGSYETVRNWHPRHLLTKKLAEDQGKQLFDMGNIVLRGPCIHAHGASMVEQVELRYVKSDEDDSVPVPMVLIDQDSNCDATIVQVSFGDRLGALIDTMKALKDLGLDVAKGTVTTDSAVTETKFFITQLNTGRKVDDPDLLERIRLTIINNLLKYHPESSERLAMGEAFGIKAPEKKLDVDIETHIHVKDDGPKRSMLYVKTADRPGLLMEIIKIIADISVNVESAEIDTEGLVAKDKFHVSYRGAALNTSLSQVLVNCLRYYLRRPETDEDSY